jgi:hypothetical protein
MCEIYTLDDRPTIFVRDKPIFSPERIAARVQLKKISLVVGLKGLDAKLTFTST